MAYQLEDEEQQPQGGARAVAGGGRGPQAPRSQTPGRGTGFVNLERVFNLNRPQAEGFAAERARVVDKQARGAQAQGQGVLNSYTGKVNANVLAGPTAGQQAGATGNVASQAMANANAAKQYADPGSVTDEAGYGEASRALGDASEAVSGLNSQAGREAEAARRGLNAGESQLSAWLQGRAGGEQFQSVADSFPGLAGMLGVGGDKALADAKARHAAAQAGWAGMAAKPMAPAEARDNEAVRERARGNVQRKKAPRGDEDFSTRGPAR